MNCKLQKEVCGPCKKSISIGQSILECELCFTAIHTKCYKKACFTPHNGSWTCKACIGDASLRYNPYPIQDAEQDKFYDDDSAYDDTVIHKISQVLQSCKSYNVQDLNKLICQSKQLSANEDTVQPTSNKLQKTQFSSYFLNIDGNKSNFENFNIELKRLEHNFTAIALAETNTDPYLQNLYQIPEYNGFYQSTLQGKSKGTGVALYIHDQFNAEQLEEQSFCNPDIESLFLKLTCPSSSETITVGVVYRPPSGSVTAFLEKFQEICSALPKTGVRILGDFNIDFLKMNNNTSLASQFEDHILSNGLCPAISTPTHRRANSKPSCIDNILTSDIDKVCLSGTISDSIGDHLPVFEISDISFEIPGKPKHIKYYNYSNENLEKFSSKLDSVLNEDHNPYIASNGFENFVNTFKGLLDSTCKLEKPKITKRSKVVNPWITDGIIAAVERKHELKRNWIKSIKKASPKGNQVLRKAFTDYRAALNIIIKNAKNSFNREKILENKHDRKKTWQIINELRGKTKSVIKPSFIIDNEKITNRRLISNGFNKYFNSIASKLNDSLIDEPISCMRIPSFQDFLMPSNPNSIYLEECTREEVISIIAELDNNKASDIPIRIIKKVSHIISPILSDYFNIFMAEGCFPEILKIGKITPIFKKGNSEDIGNYRPVSTLPIFGKLFEKVIYSRIYSFVQSQGIVNPNQFGFRKSHSTSHAVNHSVKIIEDALKRQQHVLGIFVDLSKAFDTIDHKTLLSKLDGYGIRGNAHKLIRSYLSKRTQYTEVLGEKSDSLKVEYGVPQGSVLGPLLFILYINDISRSSALGLFIMFADDTNIFVEGMTINEAYRKGNEVLKAIQTYMRCNKLHINMTKCCYINFRPKTSKPLINEGETTNDNLFIENFPIKQVSNTKFLGVVIDENLSWDAHLTSLRRKLGYASSTLYKIRDNIPEYLRKELYHTLFESHLTYCISVWGGAPLCKTSKIWTSQKRCLRLLFGEKEAFVDKFRTAVRARPISNQLLGEEFYMKEHTKPLFNKHKILALRNLYTYYVYMDLFKILKLRDPITMFEQFKISYRKSMLLINNVPAENFFSRSTKIWNIITPKLKIQDYSHKISSAKNKLKKALFKLQSSNDPVTWTANDFDIVNIEVD